jgi:hypothetical protein
MMKKRFEIVPWMLAVATILIVASQSSAVPVLDATNNAGPSSSALTLAPSNFRAQSFTVTNDGLLTQVDVQVGKFAGATSDVRLELRPLVGGTPTIDERGIIYQTNISINDIPVINSLADPPPYVSVDVSAAGIHAKPGEKYAISLRRSGSSPNAAWRAKPNTYAGGNGFFRSLLTSNWSPTTDDYGFQTWVDPTPTAAYKHRVDAAIDITYKPGTTPTLIEQEGVLYVGGSPETRPILEFPLSTLPAGAVIQGAHLELQWNGSSGEPRIEIMGYAGDGIGGFNDTTAPGTLLATTPPTSAADSNIVPLDPTYLTTLVGQQATHVGMRLRGLDGSQSIGFYTTEYPFTSILPPRLVIDYTLLTQLAGDFNTDGIVNGADYVAWRNTGGTHQQYTAWRNNYGAGSGAGNGSLTGPAIPEPASALLLVLAAVAFHPRRRTLT